VRLAGLRNPVFDGSSLMFLKEGDRVTVRDLSRGLIVDSGNDHPAKCDGYQ
jgi:D-alanyl-D-alanine carboxypeptidase